MEDKTLVNSNFSAIVNAPVEKVDIPSWCFTLAESEYKSCSPAHCSAGATTAPDGRRMSIDVEILGGSLMVQHYIEEIGHPDHRFTTLKGRRNGRTSGHHLPDWASRRCRSPRREAHDIPGSASGSIPRALPVFALAA